MDIGAITAEIDLSQVLLYAFWLFFAYLIFYLQKETRREGYPLEADETGRIEDAGVIFMPEPKTFRLPHGHGEVQKPDGKRETRELKLRPMFVWGGAPKEPTGNPMLDGVGPAAYAERADIPDVTFEGKIKIVPLRVAEGFEVSVYDANPVGMDVIGCDKKVGGTITDCWVDKSEHLIRYFEVAPTGAPEGHRVLLPVPFAVVRRRANHVYVHAITGAQFADVPKTKEPEQVTLLEEEKICGYYGGGLLYATPERQEPVF